MLLLKLAYKNMIGAGMRTWLNVLVLSFSFVVIIFYNGMIDGWNQEAREDTINWEIGGGQIWHPEYDPNDPFTLQDAHGAIPSGASAAASVPILIVQGSAYPNGNIMPVQIKGIPIDQPLLTLPSASLKGDTASLRAMIGKRMAEATKLKAGDRLLLRWRDKNGAFDAREIEIADVFNSNVPGVDIGQVWVPLKTLWEMTGMNGQATLLVTPKGSSTPKDIANWTFKDQDFLLTDIDTIIQSKKGSGYVIYLLLLTIALLAIFDTQVLSIFRRQREIGTFIALGMTRGQVVRLFTLEGGLTSLLATLVGGLYGFPLFAYMTTKGIGMPGYSGNMGVTISERIYPVYGLGLIFGTMLLVIISATIVSYMPARKIAKMNPTDALKGKLQ